MENVGIFYSHSEYFMAIGYILWPFCTYTYFPRLVMWYQEKSDNPGTQCYDEFRQFYPKTE
jgi:hypothetical protein